MDSLLFVEDDDAIRLALRLALEDEGYEVHEASDGASGLVQFGQHHPDLVLLDLRLPDLSGFEVCRALRATSTVPIIIITAQTETQDLVAGLEAGADDYVTKPFDLGELLARLRALTRRLRPDEQAGSQLELGDLVIDPSGRTVSRAGRQLELSKTEFDLLELLVRNAGIVLDHTTIYERIWNYDFGPDSKNLAVYIGYLRRKTEEGGAPRLIHTVRGVGYTARVATS